MAAEKNLENRVKQYLKDRGCWFIKYWGGGGYTKSGIPDLLVCCGGVFIGIELKSPRGHPSDLQLYHLKAIDTAGGLAALIYPKDFEQFREMITDVLNGATISTIKGRYSFLTGWKEYHHESEVSP